MLLFVHDFDTCFSAIVISIRNLKNFIFTLPSSRRNNFNFDFTFLKHAQIIHTRLQHASTQTLTHTVGLYQKQGEGGHHKQVIMTLHSSPDPTSVTLKRMALIC